MGLSPQRPSDLGLVAVLAIAPPAQGASQAASQPPTQLPTQLDDAAGVSIANQPGFTSMAGEGLGNVLLWLQRRASTEHQTPATAT